MATLERESIIMKWQNDSHKYEKYLVLLVLQNINKYSRLEMATLERESIIMKWQNDPHKYEKYLVLQGIIKFNDVFAEKDPSDISVRQVTDFIDDFIDEEDRSTTDEIKK